MCALRFPAPALPAVMPLGRRACATLHALFTSRSPAFSSPPYASRFSRVAVVVVALCLLSLLSEGVSVYLGNERVSFEYGQDVVLIDSLSSVPRCARCCTLTASTIVALLSLIMTFPINPSFISYHIIVSYIALIETGTLERERKDMPVGKKGKKTSRRKKRRETFKIQLGGQSS